jgi:hypothetical protein
MIFGMMRISISQGPGAGSKAQKNGGAAPTWPAGLRRSWHLEVRFKKIDQLTDGQVALRSPPDLGHQVVKWQRAAVMPLNGFTEHNGIDRRQSQIGEESGFFVNWD